MGDFQMQIAEFFDLLIMLVSELTPSELLIIRNLLEDRAVMQTIFELLVFSVGVFILFFLRFCLLNSFGQPKLRNSTSRSLVLEEAQHQNDIAFKFFKREKSVKTESEPLTLEIIEQEMLAVKKLYSDGHIIKDVYVAETRRLHGKAKAYINNVKA